MPCQRPPAPFAAPPFSRLAAPVLSFPSVTGHSIPPGPFHARVMRNRDAGRNRLYGKDRTAGYLHSHHRQNRRFVQAVLNQLKKDGAEIASASKDTGIKTAVTVHGHYSQTGSYLEVTFISDSPSQTTVRVAAYEKKRYKALTTEPWSTPKLNTEKSRAEAARLKRELEWQ